MGALFRIGLLSQEIKNLSSKIKTRRQGSSIQGAYALVGAHPRSSSEDSMAVTRRLLLQAGLGTALIPALVPGLRAKEASPFDLVEGLEDF